LVLLLVGARFWSFLKLLTEKPHRRHRLLVDVGVALSSFFSGFSVLLGRHVVGLNSSQDFDGCSDQQQRLGWMIDVLVGVSWQPLGDGSLP